MNRDLVHCFKSEPDSKPSAVEVSPILSCLNDIYERYQTINLGKPAAYIPELAKVDPGLFGICLATVDGQIYEVGQSQYPFTIQSISKPFVYGLALAEHGREFVMRKVGVEPTGEAFNSIIFDECNNRPYNPMVNAGAIATTALTKGSNLDQRFASILGLFERFVGHPLRVDEAVYQSERATGHRNRAIAYLELNAGMLDEPIDEHLDLYFRQCSILVTARDLAVMAVTLANNGVNPITGENAIGTEQVTSILSVMASCGMYDFSGEWLYRVGLPAKSGVGGGIVAVLPGQFGIGTFSPPLDERGNSVRGIRVCEELSERFKFHLFDTHPIAESFVSRRYTGAVVSSKRQRRASERDFLQQNGSKIVVYELQGDLYFATIEKLTRSLQDLQANVTVLILDGRRIGRANQSALNLLHQMQQGFARRGVRLILSGLSSRICQELKSNGWSDSTFFDSIDAAVEWGENSLLAEMDSDFGKPPAKLSLGEMDILRDFSLDELAVIAPLFSQVHYQPQAFIIREGEDAEQLFLLAVGTVTVSLQLPDSKQRKRLTTYIPGTAFGELALFEAGKRTADVVAESNVVCYVMSLARFEELVATAPRIYVKLLRAFGKNLVDTLRRATEEVRALASN
jgi:glutaminase